MALTPIDLIVFILGAYGFYVGYNRGIIRTIFTILSYLLGLLAAFKFGPTMNKLLGDIINYDTPLLFIVGFLLAFVLTIVIIRTVARGLENALQSAQINFINRLFGGTLLSALFVLVFSIFVKFGVDARIFNQQVRDDSITFAYLEEYPDRVWDLLKMLQPTFAEFWDHSIDFMDDLKRLGEENIEKTESENIYDLQERRRLSQEQSDSDN